MASGEVKELLKIYCDIPRMIDEEFAVIRNCEAEWRLNLYRKGRN